MSPLAYVHQLGARTFDPSIPADAYREQWRHPTDVFSVLLLLGGDVVNRALAQLAGTGFTPVAFSFGWVAYSVSALVSSVGENRLMPEPDCKGLVVNGNAGNVRDNSSWIIGRLIRDFSHWSPPATKAEVERIIDEKHEDMKRDKPNAARPKQTGLCVTVFEAREDRVAGVQPVFSWLSTSGMIVTVLQLGIAAIPFGLFGDWGTLLITATGVALSYLFGTLPQWGDEKWACRRNSDKTVVLTRGNGTQHAIVILGTGLDVDQVGRGLDLEDLAAVAANVEVIASFPTRLVVGAFAILWVLLLITAAGTKANSWFLVAVGGIGILQNAAVAGWYRRPRHFGVPLKYVEVIGHQKVMQALTKLEERYPRTGRSIRDIFFQGHMYPKETEEWRVLALEADWYEAARKADRAILMAAKAKAGVAEEDSSLDITSITAKSDAPVTAQVKHLQDAKNTADKKVVDTTEAAKTAKATALQAREAFVVEYYPKRAFKRLEWAWKAPVGSQNCIYT